MRLLTSGVGATLQKERLRQGFSLDQIALRTRISRRFLEAIEADDTSSLPGLLFTRNFVRQFAAALGLQSEPLLESLPKIDIQSVALPDAAQFARPRIRDYRWMSALSSLMWLAMAAGASVGGYAYLTHKQSPQTATAIESLPAPAPRSEQTPAPVTQLVNVPNTEPETPVTSEATVQVVLKAREASWVQIVADGRNAFTGMLQPNDSRAIAAQTVVRLTAGNAGGLEISLNGRSLDPLGPSGQVRTVRLTAEGSQPVLKTPQTSAPL